LRKYGNDERKGVDFEARCLKKGPNIKDTRENPKVRQKERTPQKTRPEENDEKKRNGTASDHWRGFRRSAGKGHSRGIESAKLDSKEFRRPGNGIFPANLPVNQKE